MKTLFLTGCLVAAAGTRGQGTIDFAFTGTITRSDPALQLPAGTPVIGLFGLDPTAPDSNPWHFAGGYYSRKHTLSITMEGRTLILPVSDYNALYFNNNEPGGWDNINIGGWDPPSNRTMQLQFDDPTGTLLRDDSMRISADLFNTFPTATVYQTGGPIQGSFTMTFLVTEIPETSTIGLAALGLLIVPTRTQIRRSKS